ncbi:hypothetical protein L596_027749 [Steinernema carpocapsae]|uniref:Uncharacterized protein n=1 Tax=Steinernema carpocapsae TaxID=34508 RepID=A0A4U5LWF9_STECR|nr:hypothetical protein L596_027749 [Steinernema carpocapsae]
MDMFVTFNCRRTLYFGKANSTRVFVQNNVPATLSYRIPNKTTTLTIISESLKLYLQTYKPGEDTKPRHVTAPEHKRSFLLRTTVI